MFCLCSYAYAYDMVLFSFRRSINVVQREVYSDPSKVFHALLQIVEKYVIVLNIMGLNVVISFF